MKKSIGDQTAKRRDVEQENSIPKKVKISAADKKTNIFPQEFEEDLGMNIRMKPQPFTQSKKKSTAKK